MDVCYQNVSFSFKDMKDIDYAIKIYFEKRGFDIEATYYKDEKNWVILFGPDIVQIIDVESEDPFIKFAINTVEKSGFSNKFGEFLVKESPLRVRALTEFGPNAFR